MEGITWFVRHVMPLLASRVKRVRVRIIGRRPTPQVLALAAQEDVEVVEAVPDVRDHLRWASALIAPLHIARGVQTKVLKAMSSARAVICSRGAAQGIDAEDGRHLLIANQPEHWVRQLQRVLTDGSLRRALAREARQQVEQVYPWQNCLRPLVGLLTEQPAWQRPEAVYRRGALPAAA